MTYSEFYNLFKEFGEVISCKLEVHPNGHNKGFGFVQYKQPTSAQDAIQKLNDSDFQGKKLLLSILVPKTSGDSAEQFTNLHIKGIPADYTEKQLTDLFAEFGTI
jgi:polyadenylate-binding protein